MLLKYVLFVMDKLLRAITRIWRKDSLEEITLRDSIDPDGILIEVVFGNCLANHQYHDMKDRAILAPLDVPDNDARLIAMQQQKIQDNSENISKINFLKLISF